MVKRILGIAVIGGGVLVASFGTKAWAGRDNGHRQNGVHVISATYGGVIVPIYNDCNPVPTGNVTAPVAASCEGLKTCAYTVNAGVIGDPAPGCWKSFSATYQCAQDRNATRTVTVGAPNGEANGQTVTLSCPI